MTSPREADAYVGLGSNLGDREAHLARARASLAALPRTRLVAVSRIYETEPVGPPQPRYLNAVVWLRTGLEPRRLLGRLLAIEASAGRRRQAVRAAPRTLDLDLLLYGDCCIDEAPELVVPHPRLAERSFVLEPLRELAPALRHPKLGETVDRLAARARNPKAVWPWGSGLRAEGGGEGVTWRSWR